MRRSGDQGWLEHVGAAVLAFVTVLALKENPLRAHFHAEQAARVGLTTGSSDDPAIVAE